MLTYTHTFTNKSTVHLPIDICIIQGKTMTKTFFGPVTKEARGIRGDPGHSVDHSLQEHFSIEQQQRLPL